MPTVTEKLVDASGGVSATSNRTVVINTLSAPAVADDLGLVGVTRTLVTASSTGEISVTLLAGRYEMIWQIGTRESRWEFTVPYTGGPYRIRHLGSGQVESGQRQGWRFAGINGSLLQLQNASTGEWHSVTVDAARGPSALALGIGAAGETSDGPNWQLANDTFWLYAPVGGTWHAISVDGTDAEPNLAIGAAGVALGGNHRIRNGRRQFVNQTTTRFHSLFLTGAAGQVTYAIGPGES